MSEIKLVSVGSLKVGSYVIVDGTACIVKNIQISKPGKHGHAKARVEAVSIVDGSKKVFVKPTHDNIEVPIIEKRNAQVLSVAGDKVTVMDMESYETFDIKIPEEFKDKIKEGSQILYWVILNEKVIKDVK